MDKSKLVKLLNLTASDADGEALTALRLATKMLKEADVTWESVLSGSIKNYKTSEAEREYAKGYRAGFKKGAEDARKPIIIRTPEPPRHTNMVHDYRRIGELMDRIMSYWDKLDPHQRHYVNNSLEFVRTNKCLPISNYDELMKISKSMWGRY